MTKSKTPDATALRQRAIRLLAGREHSRAELQRKLAGEESDEDALEALLDQLVDAGLQSDERFAEAFVRSRVERGQGPLRIRNDLRQRGVAGAVVEQAMDEAGIDWGERIDEVLARRFGGNPPADRREMARRARFLAQRGFPGDLIADRLTHSGDV